jgi:hypothetical protein
MSKYLSEVGCVLYLRFCVFFPLFLEEAWNDKLFHRGDLNRCEMGSRLFSSFFSRFILCSVTPYQHLHPHYV